MKISIGVKNPDRSLQYFCFGFAILAIICFLFLNIDYLKLISRFSELPSVFSKLLHFNFEKKILVFQAFLETICVTILSTFFSIFLGLFFGMFAARNIFNLKGIPFFVQSLFSFLRAVPTLVWVLLMLTCFGFGATAGVFGLAIHTTAFFTKVFAQTFEEVGRGSIEAIETVGANRLQIFFSVVLPSSLKQLLAWIGMRFEINFAECAILGMVGAGGIGFMVSNSIQNYDYGTAGFSIALIFIFALILERLFIAIKNTFKT